LFPSFGLRKSNLIELIKKSVFLNKLPASSLPQPGAKGLDDDRVEIKDRPDTLRTAAAAG
jgi:hypothetical protein